ncbi:hypothetical protein INS49_013226 [Diaporthe citri]|uniref:uncharacterized protein n=1 Tax=Diaporthe citri TaxID=83186 RepID=UPI001C817A60|nr:uncharacterized protein INS49_013226 [Diaporthe citri]KAG6357350.1 hypothetical protein INS49_013226 [Diaporthe citri]
MASAWGLYPLPIDRFQSVFRLRKPWSSPIPQFILDTNHPWLATNKAWLSRYPNVAEEICSRDSPLWASPASPEHALPADLFTNLLIDNNSAGICDSRLGWPNVRDRLQEMAACEASLAGVRSLHVDVSVADDKWSDYIETTLPPPGIPESFADVLSQMSNLERLDWGISREATQEFESAFVAKGLMLPSVKYLQPGAGSDYLVSRCPNVEVLEAGSYSHHWSWSSGKGQRLALIKASTGMESLKEWRLAAQWDGWTLGMLQSIFRATPNITTLHMEGPLRVPDEVLTGLRAGKYPYPEYQQETIKAYLNVLALFPNLENLHLPASSNLELGFDGGPWCGNAYDGPSGRAYGRRVVQEDAETTELAANITMSILPHLKSLSIGWDSANLTLNSHGLPDMTWPWTGRMEQYTYEIWEE